MGPDCTIFPEFGREIIRKNMSKIHAIDGNSIRALFRVRPAGHQYFWINYALWSVLGCQIYL